MNTNKIAEINRLNLEDVLWIIFIIAIIFNIIGDKYQKEFLNTDKLIYENKANYLYTLVIIIVICLYLYFFNRNYKLLKKASFNQQSLYEIKLLGSFFLIIGSLCLLYFQINNKSNFTPPPAI